MKEARSVANACFAFALFLLGYAFFSPDHRTEPGRSPRFLRIRVEDQRRHGRPEKVSISVPYAFVRGGLRLAAAGSVRAELDHEIARGVASDDVRSVWEELSTQPDGVEVVREHDGEAFRFKKDGRMAVLTIARHDDLVTIRFPLRLLEAAAKAEEDLDADAFLDALRDLEKGELLDVESDDTHVRIWTE